MCPALARGIIRSAPGREASTIDTTTRDQSDRELRKDLDAPLPAIDPTTIRPQDLDHLSEPEVLKAFCQLAEYKRNLEAALRVTKEAMTAADERLRRDYFEPQGLESVRTPYGTVSVRRDLYVSTTDDVEREEAAQRLRRSKHFSHLAKMNYNTQSLNGAVRERIREVEQELGDELLGLGPEERRRRLLRAALGPRLAEAFKLNEKQSLTFSKKG